MPAVKPAKKLDKNEESFDPRKFLATIGEGRKVLSYVRKDTIFKQGDAADAVFYIQVGKVSLSVVSSSGKEATLGILSTGDFFGEGSLAGQRLRMGFANAMTDCEILRIDKKAHDARAGPRTHFFTFICGLLALAQYPL
jgi:CRP/FNR family cyclic AMP-dependent transcriptional regulator